MISLKAGVKLQGSQGGLQPQILLAIVVADQVYRDHGYNLIITSGSDGKHKVGSLHYQGQAVDLRTRHVPAERIPLIAKVLHERLGSDFDVVVEKDHIHLEYDPKPKSRAREQA